jgi:hypothetical protein
MDPAYFNKREDRLFWTDYFRKQLDLLAQACAVWITQHMADGRVYNAHAHKWGDNGRDVRCEFQIDTDRYGATGVNFIFRLTGFVTPDNLDASFTLTTGVHIDGKDQQKFRVETDDPFAYFNPEVLFSWATQENAGLDETSAEAQTDDKTVGEASVQELLDALKMKLGSWDRFDARMRRRWHG